MLDLTGLNPQQREAVMHGDGPLLVLAGAGSGKTRVITYRIAHLIGEAGVHPSNILAVTFTNKAANEMLERVRHLVPNVGARPWIGTFHSTSLRVLRANAERLGFTKSFVVYDTSDQVTLIKRCMRELSMNDEAFPPRSILTRISNAKNELIGPAEYEKTNHDFFGSRVSEVYRLYQKRLKEFDAMDFDDLIGNHVQLIEKFEDVREEIHSRFKHMLIDEYQDTNRAQYMLIKALAGPRGNVVAVGDEDQSIYKFRGADINNILNFEQDFPGARVIKLEQNYRSTANILGAATGVVAHNTARKGKTLFTKGAQGDPVRVVTCGTEREEAQFVITKINNLRGEALRLTDFAILFRTNAQSRPFEEELLRANMPYVVVGGVKFYERAEIKDLLSFLRLTTRPHDTPSIERVINVPARRIGDTTVKALMEAAKDLDVSLWSVIEGDLAFLPAPAAKSVREFRDIVHDLQRAVSNPLPEFVDYVLIRTGYRRMLAESKDLQDETRLENIEELVNGAREFWEANPSSSLADYLDSVTLISDLDKWEAKKGVTLMTLHAAKGLEFKVVFLGGMEEGILPHANSNEHAEDLEEERRLCYVGMTRAREQLYLLHAYERRIHGRFREQNPSPFLLEVPEEVKEALRLGGASSSAGSWRERPIGGGYGGGADRGGAAGGGWDRSNDRSSESWRSPSTNSATRPTQRSPQPTPRAAQPPVRPSAPKPAARPSDSVNSLFSFFGDTAVPNPEARPAAPAPRPQESRPVQFDPSAIRPATTAKPVDSGAYRRGQRVRHDQFGEGTILTMEGSGPDAKLTVYFERAGSKKFIAKFAKLAKLN